MSEREPTQEPSFNILVNTQEGQTNHEVTRDNASLYRHIGALAMYDHAYFELPENRCTRIWRHDADYCQVERFMDAKDFVTHNNLRAVNQHDLDAYDAMIERQSGDLDTFNAEDWK